MVRRWEALHVHPDFGDHVLGRGFVELGDRVHALDRVNLKRVHAINSFSGWHRDTLIREEAKYHGPAMFQNPPRLGRIPAWR